MNGRGALGYAPNLTNAFLVTFGINLFIWGSCLLLIYGVTTVMLATAALDLVIQHIRRRRGEG